MAKNTSIRDANFAANAIIAWKNWEAADAHLQGCRAQLEGSGYGRQIILAMDKFAGECGTYFDPDFIEFFHRLDNDEGIKERFIQDMKSPDVLSAPYFIKLVFDDPREESGTVSLNGNEITMTKYTINITCQVQDLGGKMVFAKNIKQIKTIRRSNAIDYRSTDGHDLIETLEEGLAEVAKTINDHFVAKVIFSLVGPKNDDNFDENAGTILVDGEGHSSGEEFSILKGQHMVEVEMDGYKANGPKSRTIGKSGEIKIAMVSSNCEVTIKVNGPAGDKDFDGDAATISLKGEDEFSLSNGNPETVPQGKYTLTVEMDGYQTFTKAVTLGSAKQTIPVSLKK